MKVCCQLTVVFRHAILKPHIFPIWFLFTIIGLRKPSLFAWKGRWLAPSLTSGNEVVFHSFKIAFSLRQRAHQEGTWLATVSTFYYPISLQHTHFSIYIDWKFQLILFVCLLISHYSCPSLSSRQWFLSLSIFGSMHLPFNVSALCSQVRIILRTFGPVTDRPTWGCLLGYSPLAFYHSR